MRLRFFLFFALALFFVEFFLLPLLGLNLKTNLFAIFVLTAIFLDSLNFKIFSYAFLFVVFIDFWSGAVFGSFSFAIFLTASAIFFVKKFLLPSGQKSFLSFLAIFLFYQLYLFLFLGTDALLGGYPMAKLFSYLGLVELGAIILFLTTILHFYAERIQNPKF